MHPDDFDGDRRNFLRKAFGEAVERVARATEDRLVHSRYVRPPGALPELAFLPACTRCGDCGTACPVQAIQFVPTSGGIATGTPFLDPARNPCIACEDMPCATACPTDALTVPVTGWKGTRLGTVHFHPQRCITFEGRSCDVCVRACPIGETALTLDAGGHPVLHQEGCVACGVCVRDCISMPVSFSFTPLERR